MEMWLILSRLTDLQFLPFLVLHTMQTPFLCCIPSSLCGVASFSSRLSHRPCLTLGSDSLPTGVMLFWSNPGKIDFLWVWAINNSTWLPEPRRPHSGRRCCEQKGKPGQGSDCKSPKPWHLHQGSEKVFRHPAVGAPAISVRSANLSATWHIMCPDFTAYHRASVGIAAWRQMTSEHRNEQQEGFDAPLQHAACRYFAEGFRSCAADLQPTTQCCTITLPLSAFICYHLTDICSLKETQMFMNVTSKHLKQPVSFLFSNSTPFKRGKKTKAQKWKCNTIWSDAQQDMKSETQWRLWFDAAWTEGFMLDYLGVCVCVGGGQ